MPNDPCIYMDHHATTHASARVRAAVVRAMEQCGNAASSHPMGRRVAVMVEDARGAVAEGLGCAPDEVVFTSGATESSNLAFRGVVEAALRARRAPPHLVTTATEHSSVLATARELERRGWATLTVVPVERDGRAAPYRVLGAVRPNTALVSMMQANNEIGTINDVAVVGAALRPRGIPFHVDACQSFGKVPFRAAWCDLASVSAHKLEGPTGVGALYVRDALRPLLVPQQTGGTHEGGLRAGTANVHGAVGFGEAVRETFDLWAPDADGLRGEALRLAVLRDRLLAELRAGLGDAWVRVNGGLDAPVGTPGATGARVRLPHNLNVTFVGVCPISLDRAVRDRVAVSAAAACRSLGADRSHVLAALGVPDDGAVVRFGLGRSNDLAQVQTVADLFCTQATALRGVGCALQPPEKHR